MGEMCALIEAVSATVKTDEHVGAWSLTAHPTPRRRPRLVIMHPSDR